MSRPRDPVIDRIGDCRLVPVVVLPSPATAAPLADALVAGGVSTIEITLRSAAGLAGIEAIADRDDVLVGAGTVLDEDDVDRAVDAGAAFVVSPGLSFAVVDRCRQRGVPVLPGIATASELQAAVTSGLDTVKLFPASVVGGPAAIRALSGPFPEVSFVPTGGIGLHDVGAYARLESVLAIGGGWLAPPSALASGDWDRVTEIAVESVAAVGRAADDD